MRWWPLLLLLPLAGCLSGESGPDPVEVAQAIEAHATPLLVMDHDHRDASLHAGSQGIRRLGYSNGIDNSGDANAIPADMTFNEVAVWGQYAYLSRSTAEPGFATPLPVCGNLPPLNADGIPPQRGGFSIINIGNPAAPTVVGHYEALPGSDIEVSSDGDLVFLATQRNCPNQILGALQVDNDPLDVLPRGIHVVDVSDPHAPELVVYQPLPLNGPHTISYADIGGQELLFVSTYDLYDEPSGDPAVVAATQRVYIYEVVRDPAGGTQNTFLRLANTYFLTDRGGSGQLVFPHDAIWQAHPFTLQDLLYVAYWDKGVQVVDISDLNAPLTTLDGFTDFSPSSHNAIHQVRAFDTLLDGRHVTVAQPELISGDETGYITFLDTSDPTDIRKLGAWTLPGDLLVRNFDFSPHNFALDDGHVILAHNHAGLWLIDAHEPTTPRTAGYFMDVETRLASPIAQPYFWGAVVDDGGTILAVDQSSGLYLLQRT